MHTVMRTSYRGWNITASCLKHSDSNPQAARRFTARAFAILQDSIDERSWVDARPQTTAVSDKIFTSGNSCAAALITQIKTLIDTLRVPAANGPSA